MTPVLRLSPLRSATAFMAAATLMISSCRPSPDLQRPAATQAPEILPPSEPPRTAPAPSLTQDSIAEEREALKARVGVALISTDGKLIARINIKSSDDALGAGTSLSLLEIAGDREIAWIDAPDIGDPTEVRARLAEMRKALDARAWEAMTAYDMEQDRTVEERAHGLGTSRPMVGIGEGLMVFYHEPMLIVKQGSQAILRVAQSAWSPKIPGCYMLTDLWEVVGSRRRGVLLVTLHSSGSPHACPSRSQVHVIRLPRR